MNAGRGVLAFLCFGESTIGERAQLYFFYWVTRLVVMLRAPVASVAALPMAVAPEVELPVVTVRCSD